VLCLTLAVLCGAVVLFLSDDLGVLSEEFVEFLHFAVVLAVLFSGEPLAVYIAFVLYLDGCSPCVDEAGDGVCRGGFVGEGVEEAVGDEAGHHVGDSCFDLFG